MNFSEADIAQLTTTVWSSLVNVDLQVSPPEVADKLEDVLTGSIRIQGAWEGIVSVVCSRPMARRAAAAMFAVDSPAVTLEQMRDAVGELANVMGGNIKSLLPQPATLSLPIVEEANTAGQQPQRDTHPLRMGFECEGDWLTVVIDQ